MIADNDIRQPEIKRESEKPQDPFVESAHEGLIALPLLILGLSYFPKIYPHIAHIHPLFFYIPSFLFCLLSMMNGCMPKEKRFLPKLVSILIAPFVHIFYLMSAYYFMYFTHWLGFEMWKRMLFQQ